MVPSPMELVGGGARMARAPPASSKAHPYDDILRLSRDWGRKSSFAYLFAHPIFLEQFTDLLPCTFFYFGRNPRPCGA